MSNLSGGLQLKQPLSAWNQSVNADFRQLFRSLGKAATQGLFGQWEKAAVSSQEALSAIGLEGQKTETLAYLLVYRALTLALFELTSTVSNRFYHGADLEAFADELDMAFEDSEFELDSRFFDYPWESGLLKAIRGPFVHFLVGASVTEVEAISASQRLGRYFTSALHAEWRSKAELYQPILDVLKGSPFAEAGERDRKWIQYSARLDLQLDEQVFDEAFGIRQVYIPLRAYWIEIKAQKPGEKPMEIRHVVDLDEHLTTWVDAPNRDDAARVISGGPGSGKSTFCKFFAAKMAQREDLRVVMIPLHQFDPDRDLRLALCEFASRNRLIPDDLLDPESDERLLVILDGLDELAEQGKLSHRVAEAFVQQLQATLYRENQATLRLQILLSGRELAIQTHGSGLRRDTKIVHLLGYLPVEWSDGGEPKVLVEDDQRNSLVEADQRNGWWTSFGSAIGKPYKGLPKDLQKNNLRPITNQPLLNYLLALSYIRKELDFSSDPNLNEIYQDLLHAVHERGWDRRKGHPATDKLDQEDFVRILEEIALSTWHGDGRKTTIRQIRERCKLAQIDKHLKTFEDGAKEGVVQLLTAFYFRQGGHNKAGDRVFEFTHKSFGEYLTACRIVRLIEDSEWWLSDTRSGLGDGEVLVHWARVCGPTAIDHDLNGFLRSEVALRDPETCARWQGTIVRLVDYLVEHQMPMDSLRLSSFHDMNNHARNAEEALIAAHSACARISKSEPSKIDWPSETSAGNMIVRIRGQRNNSGFVGVVIDCLNCIDFSEQALGYADLLGACLVGASLVRVNLQEARLQEADLQRVNLYEANLQGADLRKANLQGANLRGANLREANLREANLREANLRRAEIQGADLQEVSLYGADLQEANLQGANLQWANFQEANLREASLQYARLQKAIFRGACLQRADLLDADLQRANLREANLQNSTLKGADLEGADLQGANLQDANLQGTNLQGVDFFGADLQGANLHGANLITARNLDKAHIIDSTGGNSETKLPEGFPRPKSWRK